MDASITASNCEERPSQSLAGNVSIMTTHGIKPPKIIHSHLWVNILQKFLFPFLEMLPRNPNVYEDWRNNKPSPAGWPPHMHTPPLMRTCLVSQYLVPTDFPLICCSSRPLVRRVQLALKYPNSFWFHNACSALCKFCNKIVFSMGHKIMDLWKPTAI